jgi:hypothetical protein
MQDRATQNALLVPSVVMKHLLSALVFVVAAAAPAAAEHRIALDYKATHASCIDASRFADEVSAKLGFVPWDAAAPAKIRVRVEKDGAQFTGTFRNRDGTSKIFDGVTCAQVTASLATTVAGAVDETSYVTGGVIGGDVAKQAQPAPDGKIPVTFESADGRRIDISLNTGGGVGRASDGATMVANYYEGLCTSPCTTLLPQGRHFLLFQDPDSASAGGDRFLIDSPTTITLHHKSRKGARRGFFASGVAITGASIIGGILIGGAGGTLLASIGGGVGLGTMMMPLFMHDTFTTTQAPR